MPLTDPITTATGVDSKEEEWTKKLVGKNLGDFHDAQTFAIKDLPEPSRIIKPGQIVTRDFRPNRLNIHLDDDGIVTHVFLM